MKFAANPSVASRLVAPNSLCTITPNGAGKPVFWLTGSFENAKPIHPDNDMLALDSGYASLVPCKLDVTDYEWMEKYKNWEG